MTPAAGAEPADDQQDRPLPARQRADLVIVPTGSEQSPRWTVKDPLALRYYHLRPVDHFVLQQLDGQTSLRTIQDRFFRQFAPQRLPAGELLGYVQQLWSQGLVQIDRQGLSASSAMRLRRERFSERWNGLGGLLAIRFRGVDPDRFLDAVLPWVGWLFSPLAVGLGLLLILSALLLAVTEWDALLRDLPGFASVFRADRIFWIVGIFSVVKICHELGHALVCKKLGGHCHELGVMLLALTPCLYCNVSDAWLMRARWKRMAVSAAGIYVELLLAAVCLFLWRSSTPGILHSLSLYVIVICSVNTLLLNGNPLLRYDGYYLFADLVNVPNLRSRAQAAVRATVLSWVFGLRQMPVPERSFHRVWLLLYGVAATIYSWLVVFVILWMLYRLAAAWELQSLVVAFGTLLILGRMVTALRSWSRELTMQSHEQPVRPVRALLGLCGVAGLIAVLLWLPLPRRVRGPALIAAAGQRTVYVTSPGSLTEEFPIRSGRFVNAGERLARLENPEIQQDLLRLSGQLAVCQRRLELLEQQQATDPLAAAGLPSARALLQDAEQQLTERREDAERLLLHAPVSGLVLPVDRVHSDSAEQRLVREGTALEERTLGSWLNAGEAFCVIAPPQTREAILYLDQSDVPSVSRGDAVVITTSQSGSQRITGVVVDVAAQPVLNPPLALVSRDEIAVRPGADGRYHPVQPVHEIRVQLQAGAADLVLGQPARAAIRLEPESLFSRFARWLRRTLTFELPRAAG